MKRVFRYSLQVLSETLLILRESEPDIIINVYWSSSKVPVIPVRFNRNLNFLDTFSKILKYQISRKIRPVGAELFNVDRWTDRHDEGNSHFSQILRKRLKMDILYTCGDKVTKT